MMDVQNISGFMSTAATVPAIIDSTSEPHPATVEILRVRRTVLPQGFNLWLQAPHLKNPLLHLFDLCL